ncbi:MAG: hypothetical protein ABFC88_12965 [Thermoguttaceae bacterium]
MIKREVFGWGVRLTVQPFTSGEYQPLTIQSDICRYKAGRGSEIRITFTGVSVSPLRIVDAQTWHEAMGAIISETRTVATEMKTAASKADEKKPAKKR